ncbi:hypothetical protein R3P38DRAFT_2565164, partial [Favolaschia claudopus]
GLLKAYCKGAFAVLEAQKASFLKKYPDAQYPCDTGVFSAATLELGGPRRRDDMAERVDPATWTILTPLGKYDSSKGGGGLILWDFGLVATLPAGCPVMIPAGLVRYSFVRVKANETRYSLVQWAGSGIRRFIENGEVTDAEFALNATREQHLARERARATTHTTALENFPIEKMLPRGYHEFEYRG